MSCNNTDITIYKNTTAVITIEYQDFNDAPIDLTGYTATGNIYSLTDDSVAIATFVCTIPTPTNGKVICTMDDTETGTIPITGENYKQSTEYWYKIDINDGTYSERIANGSAFIYP